MYYRDLPIEALESVLINSEISAIVANAHGLAYDDLCQEHFIQIGSPVGDRIRAAP